ncbi:uncharacterized protein F5Z01DRAFT_640013 [Emericellopsis atlantica]|uniref:Uncharacterized protein n=1 Tax=Emericellopsis atlantica TaxID=2614577 RepID=A0A9P7ZFI6_9HYPO|nr:uncharacterized protein F5Z01DRAFT_640013 [Emericellopsis atlantica]KAG9250776.1 hypothetical protein F5Z01DRAFT_640013 [Emericellopsis atlantica]
MDTWACTALSDVNIADASGFDQCPSPLGTDYRDQRLRNAELERAVQELREKVDEEVHKRQVVDFDRELAIDALREKPRTIERHDTAVESHSDKVERCGIVDSVPVAQQHQGWHLNDNHEASRSLPSPICPQESLSANYRDKPVFALPSYTVDQHLMELEAPHTLLPIASSEDTSQKWDKDYLITPITTDTARLNSLPRRGYTTLPPISRRHLPISMKEIRTHESNEPYIQHGGSRRSVQKVTGKTLRIQSTGLRKSTVVERGQYRGGWLAVEFKVLLKTLRNKSDEQIYGVHVHAQ